MRNYATPLSQPSCLVLGERQRQLLLDIVVRLAGGVDDDPRDRAAGERIGRLVRTRHRRSDVATDGQARTRETERAGMDLDIRPRADGLVFDVERGVAERGVAALDGPCGGETTPKMCWPSGTAPDDDIFCSSSPMKL